MTWSVSVERDFFGPVMTSRTQRFAEKCLRGSGSSRTPQEEVDGLAARVDGAEQVVPAAFDPDIGFIDVPGGVHALGEPIPPLFEFRNVPDGPTHHSGMGDRNSTFGHDR